MAKATGEVIPTPWGPMPYAVVIKRDGAIIGRIGVASQTAGETILLAALARIEGRVR